MDGNGRWAKAKGLPRTAGHVQGVETVKTITEECTRLGVKYLTLYTFSTENWNRPADEVSALMGLVLSNLEEEIFMKNNVRFRVIGDIKRLPRDVQQRVLECMEHTKNNKRMTMVVALSYSSRWELTKAMRDISGDEGLGRTIKPGRHQRGVRRHSTWRPTSCPTPTCSYAPAASCASATTCSGRCAYSELYFCDTYWPDFHEEDLHKAIADYQNRERRYGKTRRTSDKGTTSKTKMKNRKP